MLDALLRFGPLGTGLLLALPSAFLARYALGRLLLDHVSGVRRPDADERAALTDALAAAGLGDADVVVATDTDARVVVVGGTPRARVVIVSEPARSAASASELAGFAGIAAGKHAVRLPELYTGFLVVSSLAFAAFVGLDPSGFGSPAVAVALGLALFVVVLLGFPVIRRAVYAADRRATERVDAASVRAALAALDDTGADWLPAVVRPTPSVARRLARL